MLGQLLHNLAGATLLVFDLASTTTFQWDVLRSVPIKSADQVYQHDWILTRGWGQYSPWFSVPSEISSAIPPQCEVTLAQVLSRHGSRDPTAHKSCAYNATISRIHKDVQIYSPEYSFIKDYQYDLGSDHLTTYGRKELTESGARFLDRYRSLSTDSRPFIRASGQERVIMSARNWTWGYYEGKLPNDLAKSGCSDDAEGICIIIEADDSNNTLSQEGCAAFKTGPARQIVNAAKREWASIFVPPIQERLNANLPGAKLNQSETLMMMDLCPFNTVASPVAALSPFCGLFTEEEWKQYGHLQSLDKYYGHGAGNPFAPTMGVGWVNELIARLTGNPVEDHTTINTTLDYNPATFPLDRKLYADFSHDNDMTHIFFALQLYPSTKPLSNTSIDTVGETHGYSAAYTVPFAARMYVEKLDCTDSSEPMVRVLMNDRVLPLEACGGDELGRCTLSAFVGSLSFARSGGRWDDCSKLQ